MVNDRCPPEKCTDWKGVTAVVVVALIVMTYMYLYQPIPSPFITTAPQEQISVNYNETVSIVLPERTSPPQWELVNQGELISSFQWNTSTGVNISGRPYEIWTFKALVRGEYTLEFQIGASPNLIATYDVLVRVI